MIRKIAAGFGIVMLLVGVLGFVPAMTPNHLLFGIFEVNTLHNIIHLLSGIVAIAVSMATERAARLYFQLFGLIYGAIAIAGLFTGHRPLLGIALNHADHGLHAVIAVFSLIVGFAFGNQRWKLPTRGNRTTVPG